MPIVLSRFNFKFNILRISILIVTSYVNVVEIMSKIIQKNFQISIYGAQEKVKSKAHDMVESERRDLKSESGRS